MALAVSGFYRGIVSAPAGVVLIMERLLLLCKEIIGLFRIYLATIPVAPYRTETG